MRDFYSFLEKMGGLHDSKLESITWNPVAGQIEFIFDDIYFNFEGYPEYPGKERGSITFTGVKHLRFDLSVEGPLHVYEISRMEGEADEVYLAFWPSGRIGVRFEDVIFPECRIG